MRRVITKITNLILTIILLGASFGPNSFAKGKDDFYFENFEVDFYLSKQTDGVSQLKVVEKLFAKFDETEKINQGIVRSIPFTTNGGKHLTIKSEDGPNLKVFRNGIPEPIAKTEKQKDSFAYYIGKKGTYLNGRQEYKLEYEFENVITNQEDWQELFWDTNGTGWKQPFEKLSARLHIKDPVLKKAFKKEFVCHVGKYGVSNKNRCSYREYNLDDDLVIEFKATKLAPLENLSFATKFEKNTFSMASKQINYFMIIRLIVFMLSFALGVYFMMKTYKEKVLKIKKYYQNLFVSPQYVPPKDLDASMAYEIYKFKKIKSSPYVATMLELAVARKISIIKDEGKKYSIKIENLNNLSTGQMGLLEIVSRRNFEKIKVGDVFELNKKDLPKASKYARAYHKSVTKELEQKDLTHKEKDAKSDIIVSIGLIWFLINLGLFSFMDKDAISYKYPDIDEFLVFLLISITEIIIFTIVIKGWKKFALMKEKGANTANYLDGLKLYIGMAEEERLKFHQGAATVYKDNKGKLKLYEKLLPYAVIFGMEKSWLKVLSDLYNELELEPNWGNDLDVAGVMLASKALSNLDSGIKSYSSTTGSGGSSSSSSGFSSGGFSGGGGGGGGGGGW